jgi:hypothetical protein
VAAHKVASDTTLVTDHTEHMTRVRGLKLESGKA